MEGTGESRNSDVNPQKLLIGLASGNSLSPLCRGYSTTAQIRILLLITQIRCMSYKLQHRSIHLDVGLRAILSTQNSATDPFKDLSVSHRCD